MDLEQFDKMQDVLERLTATSAMINAIGYQLREGAAAGDDATGAALILISNETKIDCKKD